MLTQKIFKFEGFKEICVPDQSFVVDFDIFEGIINGVNFVSSFLQGLVGSVHGCVSLHIFLHISSNFGSFDLSLLGPVVFYLCNGLFSSIFGELRLGLTGFVKLFGGTGGCSSKNDQIKQRIGSQSVGSVHRCNCCLTCGHQSWHKYFLTVDHFCHLSFVVGGNATHIVVDCGNDGDWLFGHINICKNFCCF